mmetsp:Transcript_51607/g.109744  ORF Transcript_51607/g.109744 Transcript_51607/m.109744 type:complete len:249 (-) Transcript_51607:162-908(-)|eukprot:CAMPEP_0172534084 /NCGR_PEP_ID=MMETSP1067-20121228/6576_1 /TAXON_ID=265564 ORGANISM="Thalassiosira punctigera, Strain Tpunct2005C2" /NCGR_SAMPLE_ID=MMETSP1067 /ASSEMBLY_ACC=CAM_ASM_000444 /LENGTH=248 /DNA_ID=CAMNT_0013318823 /DNA_START=102 /DNA_END=848 /DNA_ORIENTATION=+
MGRGRAKIIDEPVDPTAWMIDNDVANFLLVHQKEVLYMCMLGYTFLHGGKVFAAAPKDASFSYKFITMILACTGGGILVPLFINSIPVPLSNDAYPIAILTSFAIHYYFPIVWEVIKLVPMVKACIIILYEIVRAKVVLTFTIAANAAIAPSLFSFAVFGPIMCGTISGCGGAFLPMNKGIEPILKGMGYPMITACVGATLVHLFLNTSFSEGVIDAKEKAHLHLVLFFISVGLVNGLDLKATKIKEV